MGAALLLFSMGLAEAGNEIAGRWSATGVTTATVEIAMNDRSQWVGVIAQCDTSDWIGKISSHRLSTAVRSNVESNLAQSKVQCIQRSSTGEDFTNRT